MSSAFRLFNGFIYYFRSISRRYLLSQRAHIASAQSGELRTISSQIPNYGVISSCLLCVAYLVRCVGDFTSLACPSAWSGTTNRASEVSTFKWNPCRRSMECWLMLSLSLASWLLVNCLAAFKWTFQMTEVRTSQLVICYNLLLNILTQIPFPIFPSDICNF